MRIAIIGLGNMGAPMALNAVKAGHHVTGFDTSGTAREAAASRGVPVAASVQDAVAGAEAVVTMLTSGAIVRAVWADLSLHLSAGTVAIDCSTFDVGAAKAFHATAAGRGLQSVDAPVSGGVGGATAGTLTFMCGGKPAALDAAAPVLSSMGRTIVRCGPAGMGQAAKSCNNMVLGVSMIAVCEAFALAEGLGLDRQAMFDVVSASSGACWSINTYCPVPGVGPTSPADNGYAPGFAAALMLKDLKLAAEAAAEVGVDTALGGHAAALYEAFVAAGHGGEDFSGIMRTLSSRRETRP
jgi:3-hydroxyisobutyrate dehydrogenase